jgi:hypothetical protein
LDANRAKHWMGNVSGREASGNACPSEKSAAGFEENESSHRIGEARVPLALLVSRLHGSLCRSLRLGIHSKALERFPQDFGVGCLRSISFRISSAQRTPSEIAHTVAGTILPPSY